MKKILIVTLISTAFIAGCATNEQTGQLAGGIIGGVLGNTVGGGSGRALATGVGIVAGVLIGGAIGKNMDREDEKRVQHTLEHGRSGSPVAWSNPDTRHRYEMTPKPAYARNGTVCREYTTIGYIGGKREEIVGTACRQRDGSWKAM